MDIFITHTPKSHEGKKNQHILTRVQMERLGAPSTTQPVQHSLSPALPWLINFFWA